MKGYIYKNVSVLFFIAMAISIMIAVTGCGDAGRVLPLSEMENQIEAQKEPPALKLSDTLSSTLNEFEVTSGNYTWNYLEGGAMTGVNACGAHPLYEAKDKQRLTIPRYNKLDSVSYSVSVSIKPDRITINEYSIEDLGNTDASPLSSKTYEDVIMPELKKGRVYELTAEWDEENLEKNRCYGTAGYVVVTDSRE